MHTRNLTDLGEGPATDEDREDELFARRFRTPARVQKHVVEKGKRSAHQNCDMEG